MEVSKQELLELYRWAISRNTDCDPDDVKSAINLKLAQAEPIPDWATRSIYLKLLARNAVRTFISADHCIKRDRRNSVPIWASDEAHVSVPPNYPQPNLEKYFEVLSEYERITLTKLFYEEFKASELSRDPAQPIPRSQMAISKYAFKALEKLRKTLTNKCLTVKQLQELPPEKFVKAVHKSKFRMYNT